MCVCCLITEPVGDKIHVKYTISLLLPLMGGTRLPWLVKGFYLEGSLILHQSDIRKMLKIQRSKNKPLADKLLMDAEGVKQLCRAITLSVCN